jgi:hypothetical protein
MAGGGGGRPGPIIRLDPRLWRPFELWVPRRGMSAESPSAGAEAGALSPEAGGVIGFFPKPQHELPRRSISWRDDQRPIPFPVSGVHDYGFRHLSADWRR